MSDPIHSENTDAIASAYVREMLELNPVSQSAKIIRRRRELWRPDEKPRNPAAQAVDPRKQAKLRERAMQYLDALQNSFYQLPAEKVDQYLRFLEQDRLPEFAVQAARFREVLPHRAALIQLDRELPDSKFSYSFLFGLIKPAAESGALHEQYIESIRHERRIDQATQMVEQVLNRHPPLYELERDWFDAIREVRARSGVFFGNQTGVSPVGVVVIVVLIIAGIIGGLASDKKTKNSSFRQNYKPPTAPSRNTQRQTDETMRYLRDANKNPPTSSFSQPANQPPGGYSPSINAMDSFDEIFNEQQRESNRRLKEMHDRFNELSKPPTFDPSSPFPNPSKTIPGTSPNDFYKPPSIPRPNIPTPSFPRPNVPGPNISPPNFN